MERPQVDVITDGPDSVIDLTTPEGEVRTDPEAGREKETQQPERREEPARVEPEIIASDERDDDEQEDPDVPRRRGETKEEYSRRVRGRINREIALRRRAERRADEQTIVNDELRQRLGKIERRQSAAQITEEAQKSVKELDGKIEEKKKALAAAIEAGDTAKQLEVNIELTELVSDRKLILRRAEWQAEQARKAAEAGDGQGQEHEEQGTAEERRIARATATWQQNNRKWWNLNKFRDVKADAIELDKALRDEVRNGELDMEEYSDEYFAELSARLKQNYPDLDVRDLDGEPVEDEDPDQVDSRASQRKETQRPAQRRPAAGSMGTRDGRRANGDERAMAQQGRVRLSQADYAQMRQYGLDPGNPNHKKAFARERMRTILTEGSGPGRGGAR